jgi:hydroxyethylthiazole kinase-like uncharacterized protein yjeF
MIKIVSNDQMRAMDDRTIRKLEVPGIILMENAGRHTFEFIREFLSENGIHGIIDVYCGKGNNGGDGYVIARHLFNNGYDVQIFAIGDPGDLTGDAKTNYLICKNYLIPVRVIHSVDQLSNNHCPALIVDALLGTGIKGAVKGLFKEIIEFLNEISAPIVSVDMPSGLNGDLATIPGTAIVADLTVTMALPKYAHLFYPAKKNIGKLKIADIGMPTSVKNSENVTLNLVEYSDLNFPILDADAHKYTAGKLFILAGSPGMTGAAALAASAALRTGVGLVNIGIPESLNPVLEIKITEGLTVPLPETEEGMVSIEALSRIKDRIDWADSVIIGPGSGRGAETLKVLQASIEYCNKSNKPTVIDADALFALSEVLDITRELGTNFVLTPHYGEFLRLTSFDKEEIQSQPWHCLKTFLSDKKFYLNLKGAPSMVGFPNGQIFVNPTGNAGLAKGGSGDVLAGIIGGLLVKGLDPGEAAITGNYIHGEAAEMLRSAYGLTSLLPSDLLQVLPDLFGLNEQLTK